MEYATLNNGVKMPMAGIGTFLLTPDEAEASCVSALQDGYGNTFTQFPVEDYAEVHVLDLRFFKGDVAEYAKENGITDTLVLYGTQNFVKDTNIKF